MVEPVLHIMHGMHEMIKLFDIFRQPCEVSFFLSLSSLQKTNIYVQILMHARLVIS